MNETYSDPKRQKKHGFLTEEDEEDYAVGLSLETIEALRVRAEASFEYNRELMLKHQAKNQTNTSKETPSKEQKPQEILEPVLSKEDIEAQHAQRRKEIIESDFKVSIHNYYRKIKTNYIKQNSKRNPDIGDLFRGFEKNMSKQGVAIGTQGFATALEKAFGGIKWEGRFLGEGPISAKQAQLTTQGKRRVNAENTQISAGVGAGGKNLVADVLCIQKALHDLGLLSDSDFDNQSRIARNSPPPSVEESQLDITIEAITKFQEEVLHWENFDGNISGSGSATLAAMISDEMDSDKVQDKLAQYPAIKAKREADAEAKVKKEKEEARKKAITERAATPDEASKFVDHVRVPLTIAANLVEYCSLNPKFTLAVLTQFNPFERPEMVANIIRILSQSELAKLDSDLLNFLSFNIHSFSHLEEYLKLNSVLSDMQKLELQEKQQEEESASKAKKVDIVNEKQDILQPSQSEILPLTIGLDKSVGLNCINKESDVAYVKAKLIEYGFLNEGEISEQNLINAIGEFQNKVLGIKKPDKIITPGKATERALATYYSAIKKDSDYESMKSNINNDIKITTQKADASFESSFNGGVKINSASNSANVNINALIALRARLNDFKNSFSNDELLTLANLDQSKLSEDQKNTLSSAIEKTVAALRVVQEDKPIEWWSRKKSNIDTSKYVLTETSNKALFTKGEISENDATFSFLNEKKSHSIDWANVKGNNKAITRDNFVRSGVTVNKEGISVKGTEDPSNMSDSEFQALSGLDENRANALKEASTHEGNFDAVNTYDRANISFGFIQFAGGNRSIEYLFARIKMEKPAVWNNLFGKYGVDVEFRTDNKDKIIWSKNKRYCRLLVHDPDDKKTYRGIEAEKIMSQKPLYAGLMMRAGGNSDIKSIQLKIAKEMYVDIPDSTKLNTKVHVLKVYKDGIGGPSIIEGEGEINKYKQTENYKTNNTNEHIKEINLDVSSLRFKDVLKSEKEMAALYGTYINMPGWSFDAFRRAIKAIIIEDELITADQVKNIDPITLLKKAKSNSYHYNKKGKKVEHKEHQDRIQTAINSNLN